MCQMRLLPPFINSFVQKCFSFFVINNRNDRENLFSCIIGQNHKVRFDYNITVRIKTTIDYTKHCFQLRN